MAEKVCSVLLLHAEQLYMRLSMKNASKLKLIAYLLQQLSKPSVPKDGAKRYGRHHLLQITHWMIVQAEPRKLYLTYYKLGIRQQEKTKSYLIQVEHVKEHSIRNPIDAVGVLHVAQDFWSHVRKRAANTASLEGVALASEKRPTWWRGG